MRTLFTLITCLLALSACNNKVSGTDDRILILATTGMIGDAVQEIVGDRARVEVLLGPGVDPHLYKASQGDLQKFNEADIIFYNGLHLEGKLTEIFKKIALKKPCIPIAEALDRELLLQIEGSENLYDPHIWFDVSLWNEAVTVVGESLIKADPDNVDYYRQNLSLYSDALQELDYWVKEAISNIPKAQRILITAHDAFSYFGRAYGIEVRGVQGISTMADYGLRDVNDLVDLIDKRGIKSVFIESSVSQKSIEAVVEGVKGRGKTLSIGATLYSDALGAKGTPEGTYVGMVRTNVTNITKALL